MNILFITTNTFFHMMATKKVKCLQYGSYYCLEVMTMSCQREVFSETEKRQRLVTQQEHKDDSYITLLSRNKNFFFVFAEKSH